MPSFHCAKCGAGHLFIPSGEAFLIKIICKCGNELTVGETIAKPSAEIDATAKALQETFGYVPQEDDGEKWTAYRDDFLIVAHHERRPRVYERGCRGRFFEIEPDFRMTR